MHSSQCVSENNHTNMQEKEFAAMATCDTQQQGRGRKPILWLHNINIHEKDF